MISRSTQLQMDDVSDRAVNAPWAPVPHCRPRTFPERSSRQTCWSMMPSAVVTSWVDSQSKQKIAPNESASWRAEADMDHLSMPRPLVI